MNVSLNTFLLLCFWLCGAYPMGAQHLSFRYLGPEQGMRALPSSQGVIDGYGHIWISTLDGLVRYNGNSLSFYNTTTHPELRTNEGGALYCDNRNYIWFSSSKGLTRFDEKRAIKHYTLEGVQADQNIDFTFENADGSMTSIKGQRAFTLDVETQQWRAEPWLDTLLIGNPRSFKYLSANKIILFMPSWGLVIIDTKERKKVFSLSMPGILTVESFDERFLYIARTGPFLLTRLDLQNPNSRQNLDKPAFFEFDDSATEIQSMAKASDDKLYITTARKGLVQYDPVDNTYLWFTHDPADPYSIMDDRLRSISCDDKGNLLLTGIAGANFTNVKGSGIQYFSAFQTEDGNVMDSRVTSVAEDAKGRLWFTTDDHLFTMELPGKKVHEIKLPTTSRLYSDHPYSFYVVSDDLAHMWVSYHGDGVAVFDSHGRHVRDLTADQYPAYNVPLNDTRIMRKALDGWMYIGTSNGLFRMDPIHFTVDTFPDHPALAPLRKARIVDILVLKDEIWVATSPNGAAWRYNFRSKELSKYDTTKGLISDRVYCLGIDKNGVVLVGTYHGLSMIYPDGHIRNVDKGNGLPGTRIESIQKAGDGSLWLTNSYNLLKYDEDSQKVFSIVGEPHLSEVGFQIVSSTSLRSGKMAFGVHKGIVLVDTQVSRKRKEDFEVILFYKNAAGHEIRCTPERILELNYNEQNIRFEVNINNMMLAGKMVCRYRLSKRGIGDWSEPSSGSAFNFNLTPGNYEFEGQVFDGVDWISAPGPIRIHIWFPWWQRWWVVSLAAICVIGGFVAFLIARLRKYKQEIVVARQIAELEAKALRAQMNPHFVFNSLNAIQECIVTGKIEEAYTYLSQFSRLLRLVLEHSDVGEVSLHEELEVLSLFVSLEQLRFRNEMEFVMKVEEALDEDEIRIPPMLIQPHLENAIWHGLRNKEGMKLLKLTIREHNPDYLEVVIEDNGIGRSKAQELREGRLGGSTHNSKGKQLSGNRLDLLKSNYALTGMTISDLVGEDGAPNGTRVLLVIPIIGK